MNTLLATLGQAIFTRVPIAFPGLLVFAAVAVFMFAILGLLPAIAGLCAAVVSQRIGPAVSQVAVPLIAGAAYYASLTSATAKDLAFRLQPKTALVYAAVFALLWTFAIRSTRSKSA